MRYLICILLLGLPLIGWGQVVAVQIDRENVVYSGGPNPLTVAVENCPASAVVLTTDNGKIEEYEGGMKGRYMLRPDTIGIATVTIYRKTAKGLKKIGAMPFRVIDLPISGIYFAGKSTGTISKLSILDQIAPAAIMGGGICGRFPITSFRVVVVRKGSEIFNRALQEDNGTRIDSTTKAFFRKLQNDDVVVLRDFIVKGPEAKLRTPNNILEFKITAAEEFDKRPEHGQEELEDPVTGEKFIRKW